MVSHGHGSFRLRLQAWPAEDPGDLLERADGIKAFAFGEEWASIFVFRPPRRQGESRPGGDGMRLGPA